MIVFLCAPCASAIRVMPESAVRHDSLRELEELVGPRSDFWPNGFRCPRCEASMRGYQETQVDPQVLALMTVLDLTPQEAFAAAWGLGLPNERGWSLETLDALLREKPIRRVRGHDIAGGKATVVDALELWDGTCVYFSASPEGAVVYRVRPPLSFVQRLTEKSDAG